MRYVGAILLLGALPLSAGCGPIVSGVQTVKASVAISAAETAGAERFAVYDYTAAKEYLQKSREEQAYSDFWAARTYADKALEYALSARKTAEAAAEAEQPVVLPEEPAPAEQPAAAPEGSAPAPAEQPPAAPEGSTSGQAEPPVIVPVP